MPIPSTIHFEKLKDSQFQREFDFHSQTAILTTKQFQFRTGFEKSTDLRTLRVIAKLTEKSFEFQLKSKKYFRKNSAKRSANLTELVAGTKSRKTIVKDFLLRYVSEMKNRTEFGFLKLIGIQTKNVKQIQKLMLIH